MSAPDRKTAVALRYDDQSSTAPRVVAKGRGDTADRILAAARAHGVPIREDKDLVELLSACELLDEIPAELYAAVAQVLAYLHALNQERGAAAVDANDPARIIASP
jgi:flagellar biosynthesis protein